MLIFKGSDDPVFFCAEFDTIPENAQLFSGQSSDPYWPNSTLPNFSNPVFTNDLSVSGGQTYYSYARQVGVPATVESRLDVMFIPGLQDEGVGAGNGIGSTIFNPGNKPSFGTPFLYNYLQGRQWESVTRSREIVNQCYSHGRDGVPGNSDAGALESWMVWNLIGMRTYDSRQIRISLNFSRVVSGSHSTYLLVVIAMAQ